MDTDVVVAGVLAGVAALLVLAYFSVVPYPILLVLGCAGIGFLPHAPHLQLEPDLVLLILLPPLLYSAAYFSSLRDLQRNLRAISLLSIGLVVFTTLAVAWIAHELVGLSWEAAFVLGAVVSPTDPVAATAIGRRVGAPRRVIAVVEGESLVNDSTALIAYKFAIAAAVSGSFSLADAGGRFVLYAVVGVAVGLPLRRPVGGGPRRRGARPRRRLAGRRAPRPHRGPSDRDHALPGDAVLRLPAGRGARRLGGARRGHRRHLSRLELAAADRAGDAHPGLRRVGGPPVPAERRAVHARRPRAPRCHRLAARAVGGRARPRRGDHHRRRDGAAVD